MIPVDVFARLVQAGYRRAPPGTLTKLPVTELAPLGIHLIDYNAIEITVYDDAETSECRPFLQRDSVTWVHVQGQPTEAVLRKSGDIFQLHSLALEDVSNRCQRPKVLMLVLFRQRCGD